MLDTCQTVDEVIAAARNFRILTFDHCHIADRNGNSAAFECINGEEIFYPGEDFPVSVLTHSTYADSIQDWILYSEKPFFPSNGSIERFRIAAGLIENEISYYMNFPCTGLQAAPRRLSGRRAPRR
jgi:hypothetical protein